MAGPQILVVEDEYLTSTDIKNTLTNMGYGVPGVADTGAEAVRMAGELRPDLILMDITLKGRMTGIEAAVQIQQQYRIPVVFLTAHSDDATVDRAVSAEPFGFLIKPMNDLDLKRTIQMALYKHTMEERLYRSEQTIRALLNAIPDALMLIDRKKRIAASNEAMAMNLGMGREGLDGMPVGELVAAGPLGLSHQMVDHALSSGTPIKVTVAHEGRWYETSAHPVTDPAGRITLLAIQSHDITDARRLEEQLEREGLSQIEQNMEQFQILNDQIRNPLQVIRGYLALTDCEYSQEIDEQVLAIDNLVTRLDRGWLESEKVRSFLIRHYRHGTRTPPEPSDGGRR